MAGRRPTRSARDTDVAEGTTKSTARVSKRRARGSVRTPDVAAAAAATVVASVLELPPRRMAMRLHMVQPRGNAPADMDAPPRGGAGGEAAEAASLPGITMHMDAEVWRRLPDDVLWKVVAMVPAAKRFQFHLVSRRWRRVLTSAEFRRAVAAARERGARDDSVVAYVLPGSGSLVQQAQAQGTSRRLGGGGDVEMDLSFVPRGFWGSSSTSDRRHVSSYSVVAAGDGLVCIVDGRLPRATCMHLCVLNPVTRTCKVVPAPPFPPTMWGAPGRQQQGTEMDVHLGGGALTVVATAATHWALAWYDLEEADAHGDSDGSDGSGGQQWMVAHGSSQLHSTSTLPRLQIQSVRCGGEWYVHCEGTLYVHAVSPGGGAGSVAAGQLVVTAQVATPRTHAHDVVLEAYWDRAIPSESVFLVSHGGRVFLTALVMYFSDLRVWELDRRSMEWHQVGEPLDKPRLDELTGFKHAHHPLVTLCGAYAAAEAGAGDLVCFDLLVSGDAQLCLDVRIPIFQDQGAAGLPLGEDPDHYSLAAEPTCCGKVRLMVGLNLVTREWELLHEVDSRVVTEFAHAFELRHNLFLTCS